MMIPYTNIAILVSIGAISYLGHRAAKGLKAAISLIPDGFPKPISLTPVTSRLDQLANNLALESETARELIRTSATETVSALAPVEDGRPTVILEDLKLVHESFEPVLEKLDGIRTRVDMGLLYEPPTSFSNQELFEALVEACALCGLDRASIVPTLDIGKTGKLNEVISHMATILGHNHPISTASDIVEMFEEISDNLKN